MYVRGPMKRLEAKTAANASYPFRGEYQSQLNASGLELRNQPANEGRSSVIAVDNRNRRLKRSPF
jgi:hypothetical protein